MVKTVIDMETVFRMQDAFRERYGLRALDHYTVTPTGSDVIANIEFNIRPITDIGQEFLEEWAIETIIRGVHDE